MAYKNEASLAETADFHQQITAVAIFLMAIKFAASAAIFLVDETVGQYLDWVELGISLIVILLILPMVAWKYSKLSRAQRSRYLDPQGYLATVAKQAMAKSWSATFVLLVFLEVFVKERWLWLPSEFFLQVVITIMLAVFSITFFYLSRESGEDDYEEGASAWG
ncbi:MAG: hypothetical protein AAF614_18475 [Chloroflexota bacterium]